MDSNQKNEKRWKTISACLLIALLVALFAAYQFYSANETLIEKNATLTKNNSALIAERTELRNTISDMENDYQEGVLAGFEARNSYPENGTVIVGTRKDRLAPLTVESDPDSNNAYYVKLVDQDTGLTEFSFFVCPGQTVKTDVPLGDYYIYYATGLQWYGYDTLFGDTTTCFRADDLFCFYYQDGYYNGYTWTLYDVPGGNLSYEEIDPEAFLSVG